MVFDNFFMILCAFLPTLPRAVLTRPSLCEKQPPTRKTHTVFYIKTKRLFALISPDFVNKLFPLQGQFCSELYRDKVKRFCLLYFNTVTRFQNEL